MGVIGGGTLGSQISWIIALSNIGVVVIDVDDGILGKCKYMHEEYAKLFNEKGIDTEKALNNICYSSNLEDVKNCDLIIESIIEDLEIKKDLFKKLSVIVDKKTIIATNTSTLLPSELKDSVKNNERFLALHFANPVWEAGFAEIMGHEETAEEVINEIREFVKEINLEPVILEKQQRGYLINALLIPWLSSAQKLYFDGVADYKEIDKIWKLATKSSLGPFEIMDIIGLKTIYNVMISDAKRLKDERLLQRAEKLKKDFLDKGLSGRQSGKGFYEY